MQRIDRTFTRLFSRLGMSDEDSRASTSSSSSTSSTQQQQQQQDSTPSKKRESKASMSKASKLLSTSAKRWSGMWLLPNTWQTLISWPDLWHSEGSDDSWKIKLPLNGPWALAGPRVYSQVSQAAENTRCSTYERASAKTPKMAGRPRIWRTSVSSYL